MNLIEQFGYEKAKDALYQLKQEKKDLLTIGKTVLVRAEIEQDLLEYRRQHNIFEVGDWFVSDTILKPFKIVEKNEDYLKLWCKEHTAEFSGNLETITQIFKNARHATDAEIQAGKRL